MKEVSDEVEEEKAKVRAVLRRIFPEVVVDDALVSTVFKLISGLCVKWVLYCTRHLGG